MKNKDFFVFRRTSIAFQLLTYRRLTNIAFESFLNVESEYAINRWTSCCYKNIFVKLMTRHKNCPPWGTKLGLRRERVNIMILFYKIT